jgi:hypothetical protein
MFIRKATVADELYNPGNTRIAKLTCQVIVKSLDIGNVATMLIASVPCAYAKSKGSAIEQPKHRRFDTQALRSISNGLTITARIPAQMAENAACGGRDCNKVSLNFSMTVSAVEQFLGSFFPSPVFWKIGNPFVLSMVIFEK